jgi:hypothetical protein
MGCATRRAAMGRLLRVPSCAAQQAGAAAQAQPIGTTHGSLGRTVLGPCQISCAMCWPIWLNPEV